MVLAAVAVVDFMEAVVVGPQEARPALVLQGHQMIALHPGGIIVPWVIVLLLDPGGLYVPLFAVLKALQAYFSEPAGVLSG